MLARVLVSDVHSKFEKYSCESSVQDGMTMRRLYNDVISGWSPSKCTRNAEKRFYSDEGKPG